MGELRHMLQSWRLGKFVVDARRLAPAVALIGLLGPAAGCGGPGSTSVVLFDEAGNEQISGSHLAGYQMAPAFPLIHTGSVAVLRPEPSGSDNGGRIDPRQLRLGLRAVAAESRDPAKCIVEITAQTAQTATVQLAISSALGCVVQYTAQIADTEQYNEPAPLCWSYQLENVTHPVFSFVLAGYQQQCR